MGDHRGLHIVNLTTKSVLGRNDPEPRSQMGGEMFKRKSPEFGVRHKMLPKMHKLCKRRDKAVNKDNDSSKKADLELRVNK